MPKFRHGENMKPIPPTLPTLSLARKLSLHGSDSTGCSHAPMSCELPCQCQWSFGLDGPTTAIRHFPFSCLHYTPFPMFCQIPCHSHVATRK